MFFRDISCGVYVIVCYKCNEFSCNIISKILVFISFYGKFNFKKKININYNLLLFCIIKICYISVLIISLRLRYKLKNIIYLKIYKCLLKMIDER